MPVTSTSPHSRCFTKLGKKSSDHKMITSTKTVTLHFCMTHMKSYLLWIVKFHLGETYFGCKTGLEEEATDVLLTGNGGTKSGPVREDHPVFQCSSTYTLSTYVNHMVVFIVMKNLYTAKTGEYPSGILQFPNLHLLQNCLMIINPIESIWLENMLGYFSLDITCSSKTQFFYNYTYRKLSTSCNRQAVRLISKHVF